MLNEIKATTIVCPVHVDNGCDVPVSFAFDKVIKQGQSLILKVNNESAVTTELNGDAQLDYFATKLRLEKDSEISLSINTNHNETVIWNGKVTVRDKCQIPVEGSTNNRIKSQYTDNKIFIISVNEMPQQGYIDKIEIESAKGGVTIYPTPVVKDGAFFGLRTNFNLAETKITSSIAK